MSAKIKLLSLKYGERVELTAFEIAEIVKDIKKGFSHFGADELDLAFYLWSMGEIGDKSTELYTGKINALFVNRILSQYEVYRKKEIEQILIKERNENFEMQQKEKQENGKAEIKEMTDEEIIKQVKTYKIYSDIPVWLVNQVIARKIIKLSDAEKLKYKKEGKQLNDRLKSKEIANLSGGDIAEQIQKIEKDLVNSEKLTTLRNIIFCELCIKK